MTTDIEDIQTVAAMVKRIEEEDASEAVKTATANILAVFHRTANEVETGEMGFDEAYDLLAEKTPVYPSLDDEEVEELRRIDGLTNEMETVIVAQSGIDARITEETIRRYCKQAGVEPEDQEHG